MPIPFIYRKIGTRVHRYVNILWVFLIISLAMWIFGLEARIYMKYWYVISMIISVLSVNLISIVIWYSEEEGKISRRYRMRYPRAYSAYRWFRKKTAWPYALWLLLMYLYSGFIIGLMIVVME